MVYDTCLLVAVIDPLGNLTRVGTHEVTSQPREGIVKVYSI